MKQFVKKQWEDIQKGGVKTLLIKFRILKARLKYALILLLTFPIFLVPIIIIRLIRPFLLIRFGRLESAGIGHFSLPIEIYLSEIDCGLHEQNQETLDIWYLDKVVCNQVLLEKWSKIFKIWPWQIIQPLDELNRAILGGQKHRVPFRYIQDTSTPWQNVDIHNVLKKTSPHLSFSTDEIETCNLAFPKMGLKSDDPIICFMVRDGAFHNAGSSREDHRHVPIQKFLPVMEKLTEQGYKVVRMGAKVFDKLESSNPSIIDYAGTGMRTELLDIFLIAHCRFMVSNGTGVDALTPTFHLPLVHLSIPQFGFVDEMGDSVIFTPKHVWSTTEKRMLTFPEIFELGAHLFTLNEQYKMANIESVNNTPEEMEAVICEMDQRISGTWVSDPEDEVLQRRFCSIWPLRKNSQPLQARIGAEFLRQHRDRLV
jgi:putative glycosyltransferase (TIGR04372 family)